MAVTLYADSARATHREVAVINITPLVDVMLVLLIIFMVATPVLSHSLDVRLPAGDSSRPAPPPALRLHVDTSGTVSLDGAALTPTQLESVLAQAARRDPATVLRVEAAGDADYDAFAQTLAIARRSGLHNVALAD